MDNYLILIDVSNELPSEESLSALKDLLDGGAEIKRCYTTNNAFLLNIVEVEPEESVEEPLVESVIEIALDDNPLTVKKWMDDGWLVKTYYSEKVQLIKMKEKEESK